jgi:hypothetical protein
MKTILDQSTRAELAARIQALNEHSAAQWGKMNVGQMLKHCSQWDEMALGKRKYKQSLLGKIFGKMALRDMLKDAPIKRNLPTVPAFKISGHAGLEAEKRKWIKLLDEYADLSGNGFVHPFFGTLSKEDTGLVAYKHADHHLRQFGV